VIQLGSLVIHEPDVVFTDLALALLGGYFGRRLWHAAGRPLTRPGAVLMFGLASAAFFGAIFHAFFPEDTVTTPGSSPGFRSRFRLSSRRPRCSTWR
jgi:hypothetical protein